MCKLPTCSKPIRSMANTQAQRRGNIELPPLLLPQLTLICGPSSMSAGSCLLGAPEDVPSDPSQSSSSSKSSGIYTLGSYVAKKVERRAKASMRAWLAPLLRCSGQTSQEVAWNADRVGVRVQNHTQRRCTQAHTNTQQCSTFLDIRTALQADLCCYKRAPPLPASFKHPHSQVYTAILLMKFMSCTSVV